MSESDANLKREAARRALAIAIPPACQVRMDCLSRKAADGTIAVHERSELDTLLKAADLLATMQSNARRLLDGD